MRNHYCRDLYLKLQGLSCTSINEYLKEKKIALIQDNMIEDRKTSMTRFLNRLNIDIINVIEL